MQQANVNKSVIYAVLGEINVHGNDIAVTASRKGKL
jgi:hypothetical protein